MAISFDNEKLTKLRKSKNLSVSDLTKEAMLPVGVIDRLENGTVKDPYFSTVAKISDSLKVNMETFKKGSRF